MSTEQTTQQQGIVAQATNIVSSAVEAVKGALVGSDSTASGATPSPPHGEAPTNSNPSGDVAFQDKSLTGKAADLTNRAVETVTTQASNLMGSNNSGAAPNPPHGEAPTNSNPSGDVAFQDKSLTGKAADLTNRAVDAVTTQANNLMGSNPSGSAPNPPRGEAPSNSNPSGDVAFQDKSLTGKAVDLTNRAVDAVTTHASNLMGSTPTGTTPNPPHGEAPSNSNPSGDVAFQDKSLTGKAADLTNRAVEVVSTQVNNIVDSAKTATQQVAQVVGGKVDDVKEAVQQKKEEVKQDVAESTTNTKSDLPEGAFVDPKTGDTKIILSGFSSGDAESLSERTGYQ